MASILILDDDPDVREILNRFLTDHTHTSILFEKTQHAELSLGAIHPDLALLDINLPGEENGVSFCWRLRKIWPKIPIVIMSAELGIWDRSDIYDCGADEIVEKPFDMRRLWCVINKLLTEGRPDRPPEIPEQ
ncbi:MAG: response regulator transcription factor [Planctomycetota bacterium]|jgi:DNA-binding response OmpR family regulator